MTIKLCWIEDLGCAHLVSCKIPYKTAQACLGQVNIKQDFDNPNGEFLGWEGRMYVSVMWPTGENTTRPVGLGTGVYDTFKQAMKMVEDKSKDYFKTLGVEVEITPPWFLKEMPYTLDKKKIPQVKTPIK